MAFRGQRVGTSMLQGALTTTLLGMSFLGRLKSFQMQGRELVLVQ